MGNNKDNPKSGSQNTMGNTSDQEFETQAKHKGVEHTGQKTGDPTSPRMIDDEDVDTAGGRKGHFSDKDRDDQAKWSPGSGESTSE